MLSYHLAMGKKTLCVQYFLCLRVFLFSLIIRAIMRRRFVTGVAPGLQNRWQALPSAVGSTPIRLRHKINPRLQAKVNTPFEALLQRGFCMRIPPPRKARPPCPHKATSALPVLHRVADTGLQLMAGSTPPCCALNYAAAAL